MPKPHFSCHIWSFLMCESHICAIANIRRHCYHSYLSVEDTWFIRRSTRTMESSRQQLNNVLRSEEQDNKYSTLAMAIYSTLTMAKYSTLTMAKYSTLTMAKYSTLTMAKYSTLTMAKYTPQYNYPFIVVTPALESMLNIFAIKNVKINPSTMVTRNTANPCQLVIMWPNYGPFNPYLVKISQTLPAGHYVVQLWSIWPLLGQNKSNLAGW